MSGKKIAINPTKVSEKGLQSAIRNAAERLQAATTSAEILDAQHLAAAAYDAARSAERLARAKGARDDVISSARRAQADAIEIEALAKIRFTEEYDKAQKSGILSSLGGSRRGAQEKKLTRKELGVDRFRITEGRDLRDAVERDPSIIRRTLNEILRSGDQPTKSRIRAEIAAISGRKKRNSHREKRKTAEPLTSVQDLRWYELDVEIRRAERRLALLKRVKNYCVPDDASDLVSNILPKHFLSLIQRESCDE